MANLVTSISTAVSGTVNISNTQQDCVLFHDAVSLAATLTIAAPSNPIDGQRFCIASTLGVTALTMTAAVGTIVSAVTSLATGQPVAYMYSLTQNKWFKVT